MKPTPPPSKQRRGEARRLWPHFARWLVAALAAGGLPDAAKTAEPLAGCSARSGANAPMVIELYTSEGCNSCPPADRWLSQWGSQPEVIALAFHVDYWDHLGWKDPFGSPAHTERQSQQRAVNGSRFSYTPQITINGVDSRQWRDEGPPMAGAAVASALRVLLTREGERYTALLQPGAGTPKRLAAYWTVTEDRLVSAVKSGENQGTTLTHDFVVREYKSVPIWTTDFETASTLTFSPARAAGSAVHPRRVNLVIVNAASGRPVQGVSLGC